MSVITRDASSLIWYILKEANYASGVRSMLIGGASSILEAGDIDAGKLTSLERLRENTSGGLHDVALCISVQDAGEAPTENQGIVEQSVIVRVYDRKRGYRNIREVRAALISLLRRKGASMNFGAGLGVGLLSLSYSGERSGHRYDPSFAVEFESIVFQAIVKLEEVY